MVEPAVVGLGLGAASLLGLGFVLQQRMARLLPHADALSPRLFADLITQPVWLLGVAAMVCGQLLGAAALGVGDVSVVEPLLTTNLLFALLLARWLSPTDLGRREWCGAFALVAGVVLFLLCSAPGGPSNGVGAATGFRGAVGLAVAGTCVGVLVAVARSRLGAVRAVLLGASAGILFGVQDGLTRGVLVDGLSRMLTSWATYALVLSAIIGLMLMQSAFEAAPLRASLPIITAAEPVTGIGYGVGVFSEQIRLSVSSLIGEAGAVVTMVVGIVLLAGGTALSNQPGAPR